MLKYFTLCAEFLYTSASKDFQSLLEVVLKNTASIATALRYRLATKSGEVSAL